MTTNQRNTMPTMIRQASKVPTATSQKKIKKSRKRPPVFPTRLYSMLENAEKEGYDHLIRWSSDGKSFKIQDSWNHKAIVAILKQNFNQTRFKSFLRQLQVYGCKSLLALIFFTYLPRLLLFTNNSFLSFVHSSIYLQFKDSSRDKVKVNAHIQCLSVDEKNFYTRSRLKNFKTQPMIKSGLLYVPQA